MSQMSDRKRKSTSRESDRPSKKQQTASTIQVSHVAGPDIAKPIVAYSPGVTFPDVKFQSFVTTTNGKHKLLLQSSDHSTLDFTAREDDSSIEKHLKHYVAVFDPETGKLQVTEAKRMTVRSSLRTGAPVQNEEEQGSTNVVTPKQSSRSALTEAFGTKKSKKAVQSAHENKLLAQGSESANEPISTAMMANVAIDDEFGKEVSLNDTLANKPLPAADLGTNDIHQVYSLGTLIQPSPAEATLSAMSINLWTARIHAKKDVKTRSRFVASRIGYLTQQVLESSGELLPKVKTGLQVLQYIQLLLDIHTYVTRLPPRRPIPPFDKWPDKTMSDGTPMGLLRPIMNHFFPDRMPKTYAVTLLRTTILALTLHIPPPTLKSKTKELATEPTEISMDFAIESDAIKKLYRELGCTMSSATETELKTWGLERLGKKRKDESGKTLPKPVFARLKFPLEFPKLSKGRPSGRR